jgi:hypothetical protein
MELCQVLSCRKAIKQLKTKTKQNKKGEYKTNKRMCVTSFLLCSSLLISFHFISFVCVCVFFLGCCIDLYKTASKLLMEEDVGFKLVTSNSSKCS